MPPVLQSACGCCSVTVGAKVLAWLDIVFYILQIIGSFSKPDHQDFPANDANADIQRYQEKMNSPLVVIPMSLVSIAVAVLLLVGIEKRNKGFVLPYLIVKGLGIVFIGLAVIGCLILAIAAHATFLIVGIILACMLALLIYFWLWVYSVYDELKESESGGAKYAYPSAPV